MFNRTFSMKHTWRLFLKVNFTNYYSVKLYRFSVLPEQSGSKDSQRLLAAQCATCGTFGIPRFSMNAPSLVISLDSFLVVKNAEFGSALSNFPSSDVLCPSLPNSTGLGPANPCSDVFILTN